MAETEEANVMSLTVSLLSAYFANNTVPSGEVLALVEGTRKALLGGTSVHEVPVDTKSGPSAVEEPDGAGNAAAKSPDEPKYTPSVAIEQSLASPDHILSLIDGKPYKALKRHLTAHNLTPAQYRERYKLPADYPMVAPGYSATRREVALKLGLGNKGKTASAEVAAAPKVSPVVEAAVVSAPVEGETGSGKPKPVAKAPTKDKVENPASDRTKRRAVRSKPKSDGPVIAEPISQSAAAPAVGTEGSPTPLSSTSSRAESAPKKNSAKSPRSTPKAAAIETEAKPKQSRAGKAKPVKAEPAQAEAAATPARN